MCVCVVSLYNHKWSQWRPEYHISLTYFKEQLWTQVWNISSQMIFSVRRMGNYNIPLTARAIGNDVVFWALFNQCKCSINCVYKWFSKFHLLSSANQLLLHTQPFYGCLDFDWDNLGELVPEETFTHIHLLWSSVIPYLLPPFIVIHGILPIRFMCLTVFFHNLCPSFLWSTSWCSTLRFILHTTTTTTTTTTTVLWPSWFCPGLPGWASTRKVWPRWCHCHSLSLAPVNPDWFQLPGFNFLVPDHPGSPGQNPRGP